MSYEGREVYICDSGHIQVLDVLDIEYFEENIPKTCEFCNSKYQYVGSVDDTNGNACCNFLLKEIEEGFTESKVVDGVKIIKIKPFRYSIIQIKKHINFDTQEILED